MPDNNMSGIEDLFNLVISKSLMISLFRKMKDLKDLMHFTNEAKSEIFFKKERTEQAGITGWTFII